MYGTAAATPVDALRFFKLLADETRFEVVRLLSLTDMRVGEIVDRLRAPQNAVSYHLKQLRSMGILRDHRSSLDARDIYYGVDFERLHTLYQAAGGIIHPGIAPGTQPESVEDLAAPPLRLLFLCTHNSARSLMAEAIARGLGGDRVEAYSAGSDPAGVHPLTLTVLDETNLDTSALRSKSLEAFVGQSFDYIITVCDRVREVCPVFPNDPKQIHWSILDPTKIEDEEERRAAFCSVRQDLSTRIRYLLLLPHPRTGQRARLAVSDRPRKDAG